jgi:hypothetical protein
MGKAHRLGSAVVAALVAGAGFFSGAPAAEAHTDSSPEPIAVAEQAGPYTVTLWIDETGGGSISGTAVIKGDGAETAPGFSIDGPTERSTLTELVSDGEETWRIEFESVVGSMLVLTWSGSNGIQQHAFALDHIPAPWWFRPILVLITPPGLWFGYWLLKRRKRAFSLAPVHT